MNITTIYSIGHGNKNIEIFIKELKSFGIQYLIDIRSKPYSKHNPQYNREELKISLEKERIKYVYLGDKLGGLPNDLSCYTDGKVDYNKLKEKEFFKQGLKRLINANNKKIKIAIMCSEKDPKECHRSKLIGEELLKFNINIKHIIGIKKYKDQHTVISELTKGKNTKDLFGNILHFESRKKYL